MASGVKLDQECIEAFNNFKLGKKEAFLVFGFSSDAKKIVVLHKEPKVTNPEDKNSQWPALVEILPNNDVRYVVADVHYNTSEGPRTDMVFLTWAPESAPIKRRMLMASSKDVIRNALLGCKTSVQATCYPDLDLKNITERFKGVLE